MHKTYMAMTIREHLEQLRLDYLLKIETVHSIQEKLFEEGNPFADRKLLEELSEAEQQWMQAGTAYKSLLAQIVNNRLNVDVEMP